MKMNLYSDNEKCIYFNEVLYNFFKLEALNRETDVDKSESYDAMHQVKREEYKSVLQIKKLIERVKIINNNLLLLFNPN
jgi:hypothetical protein